MRACLGTWKKRISSGERKAKVEKILEEEELSTF